MLINARVKTERTCVYLTTIAHQPSSSRMRGFRQASPEFSFSRECLVAEKVRENEKNGETGENPKIEHPLFLYSLAYPLSTVHKMAIYSLIKK